MDSITPSAAGPLGTAFRTNLVEYRKEAGLTPTQLCRAAGITRGMYSFLSTGKRAGSFHMVETLAGCLNREAHEMFIPPDLTPPATVLCPQCLGRPPAGWICAICNTEGADNRLLRTA